MEVVILGTIQDAGIPHIDCSCSNCTNPDLNKRLVASIAIKAETQTYMIDCTPDFSTQLAMLDITTEELDGMFISHLHMGHYFGLAYLGREAASSKKLSIYTTIANHNFFRENKPFKYLIDRGEIDPVYTKFNEPLLLDKNTTITLFEVPHRNEDGNTAGFLIEGDKSLLYIPDMDDYTNEIIQRIGDVDIALIDGSFYTKNEIMRQRNVPHPPIVESLELLRDFETRIIFTHFNHSNPVLNLDSSEFQKIKSLGFEVAFEGMTISI